MNRLALMTGILSLTLVGVGAYAQTQSGSQTKYYQAQPQYNAQPGTQTTVPGSTYEATQQRSQNQPGQQPKLYQHQDQPTALSTQPAPASGMGAIGTATGLTSPPPAAQSQVQPPAYQGQAPAPGYAYAPSASSGNTTTDIQQELTMAGYNPGPIDGIAGPRTKKAIRAFQADNGMPQDGAASPSLLSQLRSKRMQASAGTMQGQPQFQPPPQAAAQPQPAYGAMASNTSASPPPASSSDSAQKSAGFFSGWFQRMDDESAPNNQEVQPGYQPKFYRENTASQESQGPGITYPWPERSVAGVAPSPGAAPVGAPPAGQPPRPAAPPQALSSSSSAPALPGQSGQPTAADAAAMSQVRPAAGAPASGPATPNADASGTRLMTEIEKCQQLGTSSRADCEMAAHKKVNPSDDLSRGSTQPE